MNPLSAPNPRSLETNTRVLIVKSRHSDVPAGSKGIVKASMPNGYAVEITGPFIDAAGRNSVETRCIFFASDEVIPV
jgi:hypothetical protein